MSLAKSPEWDQYLEILARQIELRKNNIVFAPLRDPQAVYEQEYQKGEISGIYLTANLLPLTIEAYEVEISAKKAEENKEDA